MCECVFGWSLLVIGLSVAKRNHNMDLVIRVAKRQNGRQISQKALCARPPCYRANVLTIVGRGPLVGHFRRKRITTDLEWRQHFYYKSLVLCLHQNHVLRLITYQAWRNLFPKAAVLKLNLYVELENNSTPFQILLFYRIHFLQTYRP